MSWYKSAVEKHIIPALGSTPLDAITPPKLKGFYKSKLEAGRLDGTGGLSAGSVRRLHITLSKSLQEAVRSGLLARNPARLATPPRIARGDATERVWTGKQLRQFLSSVSGDRLVALWRLLALTGLRRSEGLGLRWTDVDWDGDQVFIRRALVLVDGRPQFSQPKTGAARRAVELDPGTVTALRAHRVRQHEERLACGEGYADLDLVFAREDGAPLRPDFVTRRFQQLSRDAALPGIGPHGLRHTHATALLAAGTHPKIVQSRLGHTSARVTLDIYSSVLPGMQREAVAEIAAAFE